MNKTKLTELSISEVSNLLKKREVSPVELVHAQPHPGQLTGPHPAADGKGDAPNEDPLHPVSEGTQPEAAMGQRHGHDDFDSNGPPTC